MQYEKAARYRDILAAIETLGERQIVSTLAHSGKFTEQNEDYLGLARCGDVTAMVVLKKRTGRMIASEYYFLDGEELEEASGKEDKAVSRLSFLNTTTRFRIILEGFSSHSLWR
jgi:excinuclease UvrABC nuclease subunit